MRSWSDRTKDERTEDGLRTRAQGLRAMAARNRKTRSLELSPTLVVATRVAGDRFSRACRPGHHTSLDEVEQVRRATDISEDHLYRRNREQSFEHPGGDGRIRPPLKKCQEAAPAAAHFSAGIKSRSATSSVQPRSVADSFSKIENPSSRGLVAPRDRHREQGVRFRASSS